jgi:hypothetical protein
MGFRTGIKPAVSFDPESKISAGFELLALVNLTPARMEEVAKMESLVSVWMMNARSRFLTP